MRSTDGVYSFLQERLMQLTGNTLEIDGKKYTEEEIRGKLEREKLGTKEFPQFGDTIWHLHDDGIWYLHDNGNSTHDSWNRDTKQDLKQDVEMSQR